MNRKSFFKSLLTIIVAPVTIVKALTKPEYYWEYGPDYFRQRTIECNKNREWADGLTEEQRAHFEMELAKKKLNFKGPPPGQCYVVHKGESKKLSTEDRLLAIYHSNPQA